MYQVIKKHSPIAQAYADGRQLYLSFKPEGVANEKECLVAMESSIKAVRAWMKRDKMKLNDSKTEFLIIVTRSTAEQSLHYFDKLSVGDSTIKAVSNLEI